MPRIHYQDRLKKIDFDESAETEKIIQNAQHKVIFGKEKPGHKLMTPKDPTKVPVAHDMFAPKKGHAPDRELGNEPEVFR